MISCELIRALTMASLPIALLFGGLSAPQLYVAAFIGATGYVLFSAAEAGAVPAMVDSDDLTSAVSAQEVASSGCGVLAPPLGGVLFGIASGLPFAADAISFLFSATATAKVRLARPRADKEPAKQGVRADIVDGVRWLWNHRELRAIGLLAAGMQIAISGVGLTVIITARREHASTATIGFVLSAVGVGGILGGLLAPRLDRRLGLRRLLLTVVWLQGLLWLVFALTSALPLVAATLLLFAATMPLFGIAVLTYQMRETPDVLRGRVSTTFSLLIWGATPVGAGVAGLLLESYTTARTSLCFAAWVLALAAIATTSRSLRERTLVAHVAGASSPAEV
jgi:predicted MFS family arabinose efflux permease